MVFFQGVLKVDLEVLSDLRWGFLQQQLNAESRQVLTQRLGSFKQQGSWIHFCNLVVFASGNWNSSWENLVLKLCKYPRKTPLWLAFQRGCFTSVFPKLQEQLFIETPLAKCFFNFEKETNLSYFGNIYFQEHLPNSSFSLKTINSLQLLTTTLFKFNKKKHYTE